MAVTKTRAKVKNGTGVVDIVSANAIAETEAIEISLDRGPGINVGFGVIIVGTSATYTVQHTFDADPLTAADVEWHDHADIAAETTTMDGNYAFGITGVRLSVAAVTAAVVTLTVVQAGDRSR